MNLFPAIDLRGGKVVRLTQGDYDRMTVYGEDPCAQARQFVEAGARYLHVVDLDGAKDGTLSNYRSIAALAKQGGLYIEVGGGIRTEERIEKYLSLGVDRCILGSVAVTDFDFTARMLKRYGERIAVGVDAKDGFVAIHGWKEVSAEKGVDFCRRLADAGCTAIIYTDIACDGAMQGTNLALYRQLAAEVPGVAFTASGGISSEQELLELEEMGLSFFSSYAQDVPCHMMESTRLSSMIAIGTDYTQNTLDAVRASAIDVLECSIQPGENYGTSMNYADILRYSDIAAKTAKPCVVPTQRRIRPEEVRHLAAAGCKAIMIGAVVMGGARPEDVKRATAAFRAAADAV